MSDRLRGKVAVISGAGSGMGAAMAKAFVAEGASVIAADISGKQNDVAREIGSACVPLRADVSSSADVQSMLQAALRSFGRLDIVCNNAGIDGEMAPLADTREEEFDRIWGINGRGVFLAMKYAIPILLKSGGGSIINTASMASVVAFPTMSAYCAAKGAVLLLTKTAAVEYANKGIRVNAICPGSIRTPMTMSMPPEYIDAVNKVTPVGRMGEPGEVANLAVFLASDESKFITGASVLIDGGYTSL